VSTETVDACCKINLGLHVLRKRDDGYHDIETVLFPIPWCDAVSFTHADAHSFSCSDPRLPVDATNLCVKARLAFEERFGETGGLEIHLDKRVPYGSGLGGGSSDAAAVLRFLAASFGIAPTDRQLLELAGEIGSDVPFFLLDAPAFATSRGERLEPVAFDFPYHIVIATPDVSVNTGHAYGGVIPRVRRSLDGTTTSATALVEVVRANDTGLWRTGLINDFEAFVFGAFPQLERLKGSLYGARAQYAALSGSGSAVYGLFSEERAAESAARVLQERGIAGWIGDRHRGKAFAQPVR
jgi:4-diphosphocytidyl-2-C-methyl-D-erythritol kinase